MAHNIDTALLRAFVAVAETGGMTSAGRILNLTQAAVSQQVKRLEDIFQRELFEREKRAVRLTGDGDRLLPLARQMLEVNDRVWGMMTSPDFEGEVRIGVPHDIVQAFMPPVLRSFDRAWPRVQVRIMPLTTPELLEKLDRGGVDLTLTTEPLVCGDDMPNGECLIADEMIWVGAPGGRVHNRDPLPVSLGAKTCAFRAAANAALTEAGRDWVSVAEEGNMESVFAAVAADIAIAPLLVSTVPAGLDILTAESGLPALPKTYINMYLPKGGGTEIAQEFARHTREQFQARYRQAA